MLDISKKNNQQITELPMNLDSFEANWSILKSAIGNRKLLTTAILVDFFKQETFNSIQISLLLRSVPSRCAREGSKRST